jgi:hypothetical protein
VRGSRNIRLVVRKTRKVEKVTSSQDDPLSAAPTALGSSSINFPALPGWADVWLPALRASAQWRFCRVISLSSCRRQVEVLGMNKSASGGLEAGRVNSRSLHYAPPDFLWNLVALANFMRLSLRKGAHAASSSAAWQEIRVRSGRDDNSFETLTFPIINLRGVLRRADNRRR